ncbi:bacteriocin ABC transporter ATP-binding protein [Streptomyces yokosukanensis]|uniref:Bacteriocin ABC transporter ATP-binding protein n=1 Tax=Streptomyces yokosukanensis TaxID=67386 RepID=A0A101NS05_9ACTN|nr:ABC transporter ATP-binding protein [Streptomyces yokosukanensis]KUM98319.1 bacteriocin ABC transporter ATP-binding protein [Streptomyces yokosukanensis]
MDSAVVVEGLVKKYKDREQPAVDGLSFSVRRGEVFGFLGPNGAGKTTTIGILTTRVAPTSGRAFVQGVDVVAHPAQARRAFAVVPQRNNLDQSLTLRQNLTFHAGYHGVGRAERNRRAAECLEWVGLADRGDSRGDKLSGGQAQRVMIARALMHRPDVLFLDEPANGLDPQARLFIHERVSELRERGVTTVLTTHDMDEAARLCDRVGIVDHGRLLALDTPQALMESLSGTALTLTVRPAGSGPEDVIRLLEKADAVTRVERTDQTAERDAPDTPVRLRLYSDAPPGAVLPAAVTTLTAANCDIKDIKVGTATLEDVFISLTGRELR